MFALACPMCWINTGGVETDGFAQFFEMVNRTIESSKHNHRLENSKDWLDDLEAYVKMASFAARNQTGDPSVLWQKTSQVAQDLQNILDDPRTKQILKRQEIIRLRALYHELAVSVGIFSICGDSLLHDILYQNK